MDKWTAQHSAELYNVAQWGDEYFSVSPRGHVEVSPEGPEHPSIDLHDLIQQITRRGVAAPLLVRFDGILRSRVRGLHAAFNTARAAAKYPAPYRGVFPIKVNQDRHVVETLLEAGRELGMGLEVGSKPELMAGIALQAGEGSLMICNGYKDEEYVEMALSSTRLGIEVILVIEKLTELATILAVSDQIGIRPKIGVRSKLSFKGSGRWKTSVGDRSKFGLTAREMVTVAETLRERGQLDCLALLHFHIGSQITDIRSLKQAMREGTNILVGLSRMGAKIRWFDAGGGLGIDYDGSKTSFESSKNYSLQEYANDVVWHLAEACREAEIEPPTIVTESGRALVAHHAVLIGEVVGKTSFETEQPGQVPPEDVHDVVLRMAALKNEVNAKTCAEVYHDALELRDEAMLLFNTGQLDLESRAWVEDHFWSTCQAVLRATRSLEYVPEELGDMARDLSDTYFVNFSLFQSLPDSWAIGQLFPVLPVHRLEDRPARRAVIADLTCDSDGKINRFIDLRDVKQTLELHDWKADAAPYYLGFFLVGAYQEILGDMHNLFGDTNVVHVDLDERGRPKLSHVVRGDRVKEVLAYVEYFEDDLMRKLRAHVENALEEGRMDYEESAHFLHRYEAGLRGYTYLARRKGGSEKNSPAKPHEDPAELPR